MRTNTSLRLFKIHYCIMSIAIIFTLVFFIFHPSTVFAEGIFIPAASRTDMVYDNIRDVVYITNGDTVLRYHLSLDTFLPPFQLGGSLSGIDLSPDGNTLVVADRQRSDTQVWIHLVDLSTEQSSQVFFPRAFYEGGTFTVVYANDGTIFVTSTFEGSGWVPMRRYDSVNDTTTTIASVRQDTMLTASADGNVIAFAESNISDGSWGTYDISTGTLTQRTGYTNGTGWFNYEIGTNRSGTQYAIPTYGGTYIYDSTFSHISTVGNYAGQQPIGVVYHPITDIVYFAWAGTNEVRGHDTTTFAPVETYDFEYTFSHTGNHAFTQGRLKISRDGRYLLGTVGGGVRVVYLNPPDLALTKSVIPTNPVAPGTPITYTIAFSNTGDSIATDVSITDMVPITLTNVNVAYQGVSITDTGLSPGFNWNVEDLAPLQGGIITITGRVSTGLTADTIFTNTATITSSTPDSDLSNNQSQARVEVVSPILSISKAVVPDTNVAYRGEVTYTIVVSNNSSIDAGNVFLTDTLPISTTFNHWVGQSGATENNDQLTWNGTVAAGQVITCAFVANHIGDYGDVVGNDVVYTYFNHSGSARATFTVEPIPITISVTDASIMEGNNGQNEAIFDVILSLASTQTLTVSYTTTDGVATVVDNDYIPANGMISFVPGSSRETISVTINGDTKVESDENFYVNLTEISSSTILGRQDLSANAIIVDGQGIGIIVNDDISASHATPSNDHGGDNSNKDNAITSSTSSEPVATVVPLPVAYLPETGSYDSPNISFWAMIFPLGLGALVIWRVVIIFESE